MKKIMKFSSRQRGQQGEEMAVQYLKKNGFCILERNHGEQSLGGPMQGEVDIVAEKDGVISFVEVKAAFGQADVFFPEDRVNWGKRKKIERVAEIWLSKNKKSLEVPYQIDVVAVNWAKDAETADIRYIPNI